MPSPPSRPAPHFLRWPALIALTLLLRALAIAHPAPLDDEGVYAVMADVMVDGGRPYVDAIERKPPLLFWLYQACFSLAGKNAWYALHTLAALWTLGTMLALHRLTRGLFDRRTAGWAALLYCIFMTWGDWKCLAFNGELIMNLPLAWAALLVLAATRDPGHSARRALRLLAAGMALGCAVLIKQPAGVATVPLGLLLLLQAPRLRDGVRDGMLLTLGFCLPLAAVAARFWSWGMLDVAWYWSVGDHDIPHGPRSLIFWKLAAERGLLVFVAGSLVLSALCVLSLRWRTRAPALWHDRSPALRALCGLIVASFVGAAWSGRFYPHYFLQVVPWMSVLAAPAAAQLDTQPQSKLLRGLLLLHALAYLCLNTIGLWPQRAPSALVAWVRQNTQPRDPIFVWGHSVALYALTDRAPSSRYITTFPLTGYIFGSPLTRDPHNDTSARILPGSWQLLQQDLCAKPPALIIDTEITHPKPKYPAQHFPRLWHWLQTSYEVARRSPEGLVYQRVGAPAFCAQSVLPVTIPAGSTEAHTAVDAFSPREPLARRAFRATKPTAFQVETFNHE